MPVVKHLNKRELVDPSLLIKYNKDHPPSITTKKKLVQAVSLSAKIMRAAVWKMDKVVFFRRDEEWLKGIVETHFHLGGAGETKLQRLRYLNQVRMCMLSTSFHLNTGVYLLDIDASNRKSMSGSRMTQADVDDMPGTEGYVTSRKIMFFEKAGPVHVDFDLADEYSLRGMARLIIHEATHSFWKTADVYYSHEGGYSTMTPKESVSNADSYAYAALSIEAKSVQTHATLEANGDH